MRHLDGVETFLIASKDQVSLCGVGWGGGGFGSWMGQPGPRGRGLNGAMLGSGVKWIRDGRGLSPYVRALLVKMIKMFANGNGFLH